MVEFAPPIEPTPLSQLEFHLQVSDLMGWETDMEVAETGEVQVKLSRSYWPDRAPTSLKIEAIKSFVGVVDEAGRPTKGFTVEMDQKEKVATISFHGFPSRQSLRRLSTLEHFISYPDDLMRAKVARRMRRLFSFMPS